MPTSPLTEEDAQFARDLNRIAATIGWPKVPCPPEMVGVIDLEIDITGLRAWVMLQKPHTAPIYCIGTTVPLIIIDGSPEYDRVYGEEYSASAESWSRGQFTEGIYSDVRGNYAAFFTCSLPIPPNMSWRALWQTCVEITNPKALLCTTPTPGLTGPSSSYSLSV